jgi:hypothetical protein
MKTYKNLYPQVYAFDNLYLAFRAARKGKRSRAAVAAFEFDVTDPSIQTNPSSLPLHTMDEILERFGLRI